LRLADHQQVRPALKISPIPPLRQYPSTPSRLATLDGDPGVRPGSCIFVGGKAPWFEISDGPRQYRPMSSFFAPERRGDTRV
jgi:hypothetical protein